MLRQTLRAMGIGFWSLLSLDIVVGVFDYYTRWDFIKTMLADHPRAAALVHTPIVYLALLLLGFIFLQSERKLKLPYIRAKYTNIKIVPDLTKIPMKALFDTEQQKPGWDTQELAWFVFVELQLANESTTPVTVEEVDAKLCAPPANWSEKLFPFKRRVMKITPLKDLSKFELHRKGGGFGEGTELPSLLNGMSRSPLTQGVGHRGWLCFAVNGSQRDLSKPSMDIWLIDALGGRHRLAYRKDEHKWDKETEIHPRL